MTTGRHGGVYPARPPRTFEEDDLRRARNVDLPHLAATLGLDVNTRSSAGVLCTCPNAAAHGNGDATPSLRVHTRNRNPWPHYHCYVCDWHGDAIALVQEVGGLSFPAAVRHLTGDPDPALQARVRPVAPPAPADPEAEARVVTRTTRTAHRAAALLPHTPEALAYLEERGLAGVAQAYRLGYNPPYTRPDGTASLYGHRIVIPHVMPDNSVPYAKYRALDPNVPKHLRHLATAGQPSVPYLWAAGIEEGLARGYVVMCEGEMDALSIKSAFTHDPTIPVVGLPGVQGLRPELDEQLAGLRIILVLDADDAGQAARRMLDARLGGLNCVLQHLEPVVGDGGSDINDSLMLLGPDLLAEWLEDAIARPQTRRRRVL